MSFFVRVFLVKIIFWSVLFTSVVRGEDSQNRLINIDDLLAIKAVSNPQISPDKNWVAYEVTITNTGTDDYSSHIYMISSENGEIIQLTSNDYSAWSPQWSPDNRYLGFLATRSDQKTQLWLLDRRGGDSQQYTYVDQGIESFSWSPDGDKLLFVIKDKTASDLASENSAEPLKPLPYVIDRLQFKRDGIPYLDRSRTHIYIMDSNIS